MDQATGGINPIVLEVLWNRLLSVVNEQQVALMRTAFSTVAACASRPCFLARRITPSVPIRGWRAPWQRRGRRRHRESLC